MNTFSAHTEVSETAVKALAVVGFIALMGASMWLAVYSTRFVPSVVGSIGAAAVSLGSVFKPAEEASLSVVPTPPMASSTLSHSAASSTPSAGEITIPTKPTAPTAGEKTTGAYPMGATTTPPATLSGLPDFVVTITGTGYLATNSAESFVASSTVPAGSRPAVKFSIKNIGTNATGSWRFSASIPTQTAYVYLSQPQQSLNPGDSIDYTLGFDQASRGAEQTISITANADHTVAESSQTNNNASAKITVLGS